MLLKEGEEEGGQRLEEEEAADRLRARGQEGREEEASRHDLRQSHRELEEQPDWAGHRGRRKLEELVWLEEVRESG